MAKTFEAKYFKGSFADTYGRTATLTGTPVLLKGEKGFMANCKGGSYLTYSSALFPTEAVSVVVFLKPTTAGPKQIIGDVNNFAIGRLGDGGNSFGILAGSNYVFSGHIVDKTKYCCLIFTVSGSSQAALITAKVYLDNISQSTNVSVTTPNPSRVGGNNVGSGAVGTLDILYLAVHDTVLTDTERAEYQSMFESLKPISKPKRGFILDKPTDLSREVNKVLGSELVTNGDFSSWTSDNPIGWNVIESIPTNELVTQSLLGARLVSRAINAVQIIQNSVVSIGKTYKVIINITELTGNIAGQAYFNYNTNIYKELSLGINQFTITTTDSTLALYCWDRDYTVSSVSVKELTGLVAAYNMKPKGNVLVDISGNGKHITLVGTKVQTPNGLYFPKNDGLCAVEMIPDMIVWTESFRIRNNYQANYYFGAITSNIPSAYIIFHSTAGGWCCYYTDYQSFGIPAISKSEFSTFSFVSNGTTVSAYLNGVFVSSVTPPATNLTAATLFNQFVGGSTSVEWVDLRLHNRALSLQEIKDYHNSFVSPYLVEDFSDAPADGSNVVPTGWTKGTGSYKIGELVMKSGDLVTNGTNEIALCSPLTTGRGTSSQSNERAYQGAYSLKFICSSDIGTHYTSAGIPIIGRRYKVSMFVYLPSGQSTTQLNLVEAGAIPKKSTTVTDQWVELSGYFTAEYITGYGINGNQTNCNGDYWYIDNISITEVLPLPTFKQGQKYLECTSAGTISLPSSQAYGEWSFDLYKGATANDYQINIISSAPAIVSNSYRFNPNSVEALYLQRLPAFANVTATSSGYFANNTWYRVKITRTQSGVFTLLIKGGVFTPTAGYDGWTLVSTSGGSGTNPGTDNIFTTSSYFVISGEAGDRITNIKLTDGIKQI